VGNRGRLLLSLCFSSAVACLAADPREPLRADYEGAGGATPSVPVGAGGSAGMATAGAGGAGDVGGFGNVGGASEPAAGDSSGDAGVAGSSADAAFPPAINEPPEPNGAPGPACAQSTWTFFANTTCAMSACALDNLPPSQVDPANAIDGDLFTRYSTGSVQTGGEFVTVTFAAPVSIDGIELFTSSLTDAPVEYDVSYSTDGVTFMEFTPQVRGSGTPDLVVSFLRTTMLAFKVTQTGAEPPGNISWWSIHELTVEDCE
jgi:F5/8 type C domain